MTERDVYKAR